MARTARIFALILALAVIASVLTSCAGSGPATTGGTTPAGGSTPGISETQPVNVGDKFTPGAQTPKFFSDLIALKTPLIVVFYQKSDPGWGDVSKEIDAVQKRYGNQAEFLRLSMDDSYNMASLDASAQAKAQQVTELAHELNVRFTPFIVLIDRNQTVTYTHSGYIDSKTFEQELFNALKR